MHTSCIYACDLLFRSMHNLLEASSYPGSLCPALASPEPLFPVFIYSSWLTVCHNPTAGLSFMAMALAFCRGSAPTLLWYLLDVPGGKSPTCHLLLRNI